MRDLGQPNPCARALRLGQHIAIEQHVQQLLKLLHVFECRPARDCKQLGLYELNLLCETCLCTWTSRRQVDYSENDSRCYRNHTD